jgi:LysM repeat protein/RNA polymerase subunit RPABC4/transcription elongation factor Spt4
LSSSRPAAPQCPECGAFVARDAEVCRRCGTRLRVQRWRRALLTMAETLLVAGILGSLVGAVWLMRPEAQASVEVPGPRSTPTPLPTSTATYTRTPTPTTTSTPTITPTPTPSFYVHTVTSGDTLIGIALGYGVTLESILDANNLSENDILSLGQELIVPLEAGGFELPTATATPLTTTSYNVVTHTIQSGDTLLAIAQEYDTTVAEIVQANGLTGEGHLLQIGQVLVIASELPTPTPATPTPTTTPTQMPTPLASPTAAEPLPTPQFALPAPVLVGPPDDALVSEDVVLLNWLSVGLLADDVWYAVRLRTAEPGQSETTHEALTKATAWWLPDQLAAVPGTTQRYRWDVRLVRLDETEVVEVLSPPSEIRTFRWERE